MINQDEYSAALILAHAFANAIRRLPLNDMLAAIGRAHAIGPIVDPTLYHAKMKALQQDEQIVRILATAKREFDALPWATQPGVPFSVDQADGDAGNDGDASLVAFGRVSP